MERSITYRRNALGEFIILNRGHDTMQKISLEEMTPEQKVETLYLSEQWRDQPQPSTPAHTSARHRSRVVADLWISKQVADFVRSMAEHNMKKKEELRKQRQEMKK